MSFFLNLINSTGSLPEYQFDESPNIPYAELAMGGAAVIGYAILTLGKQLTASHPNPDMPTIHRISKEIVELDVTIGDAASFFFSNKKGQHINDIKTKEGTLATMKAFGGGLKSSMNGKPLKPSELKKTGATYANNPKEILKLGQSLLKAKSGQCDHMAASVVAKIVHEIQQGNQWNSRVEIVGNGVHAFVIIGRKEGSDLNSPSTWSKQACIVDTWLATVGVNDEYKDELPTGEFGVITDYKEIIQFQEFFDDFSTTHDFSPEELNELSLKL